MEPSELEGLFASRRYRDLARALGPPRSGEGLSRLRLRAQLAGVRWGTVVDSLRAAEALTEAGEPDAARYTAQAIRALFGAGAHGRAAALLESASERWPQDPHIQLTRVQAGCDEREARSREEHDARVALREGRVRDARRVADRAIESGGGDGRTWALKLAADLARAARDWDAAAAAFDRIVADAPDAFDAPLVAASAALCRWAGGHGAASLGALREIRARTRGGRGEQGAAYLVCNDVLDRVEREDGGAASTPAWVFSGQLGSYAARAGDLGAGAASVVLAHFGVEPAPIPDCANMATLRHRLHGRGLESLRFIATGDRIETALREGALVVLEEERSTRAAFPVVAGIEPRAGLLLIHETGRGGAYLTTLNEQRTRGALYGGAALAVLGPPLEAGPRRESLAKGGLEHDARLDAVDLCDLGADGRVPPRARVEVLARAAAELAPTLPSPQRRFGESLLAQLRAGRLGGGRMERWVAVTRERFPNQEWALQIYAQALEYWGRPHEAGIAWADAQRIDAWDERNTFGRARAHERMGQTDLAQEYMRRTLSIAPGHAQAMARAATLALEQGELGRARALSELAEDIAPAALAVLKTRATILEREDRFDEALERLVRAAELEPRGVAARGRILRRHLHAGRWEAAAEVTAQCLEIAPGDPYAWADQAFVQYVTARGAEAAETVLRGLSRCGPERGLIEEAFRVSGSLLDDTARQDFIGGLETALASAPLTLMDTAVELTRRRLDADGVGLALRTRERMGADVNGVWRAAQTLIAVPEERAERFERIESLLRETIASAERYPHPRVVLALHTVGRDPDAALALVQGADLSVGPVLVWKALSVIHGELGQRDEQARVDQRLSQVDIDALIGAGSFLRNTALPEAALGLLELAESRGGGGGRAAMIAAYTRLRYGDVRGATEALARTDDDDPFFRCRVAIANEDWPRLRELAADEVQRVTRRSGAGVYDGWVMRARLAGAQLALGDDAGARRVREVAGRHPEAMAELIAIERKLGAASVDLHLEELRRFAPGAAWTVDAGGERW